MFARRSSVTTRWRGVTAAQELLAAGIPVAQALAMADPIPRPLSANRRREGIPEGAAARHVLLAARTPNEAMCRPQADRIVLHAGRRVTSGVPGYAELDAVM